jgi:hypothetical protein
MSDDPQISLLQSHAEIPSDARRKARPIERFVHKRLVSMGPDYEGRTFQAIHYAIYLAQNVNILATSRTRSS